MSFEVQTSGHARRRTSVALALSCTPVGDEDKGGPIFNHYWWFIFDTSEMDGDGYRWLLP